MPEPHGGNLGDEGFIGGHALSLESTQDVAMDMRKCPSQDSGKGGCSGSGHNEAIRLDRSDGVSKK